MALAASLNWLGERHRSDYELDPKGVTYFVPFIHEYVPDLAKLLPFYQLVGLFDGLDLAAQIEVGGTSTLASLPRHITAMLQRGQRADYQELEMWWKVREATLNQCHDLYERLDVRLTRKDEYGESRYNPLLPRIVQDLLRAGVAVKSDGATAIFADGLDRSPLLIEKADEGGYLYGTTDIAAIWYRTFGIGARRIIYFVDARQASHFNLLFKAVRMAGWDCGAELQHAAFGTMLGKDNKPFKTRSGDTVKLKDLLDEAEERAYPLVADKNADLPDDQKREVARAVGIGAVKYSDLSKDRTSDYVFDWDSALALTGNSAPYLQYAHARICAIFRKAGVTASVDTSVSLEAPEEVALSKHILRLGEALDTVAVELKPHVLCAYLYDLATRFSAFYENCPVLKSEEPTRSSRLALCALTARTLALGLDLLGIKHPDQMELILRPLAGPKPRVPSPAGRGSRIGCRGRGSPSSSRSGSNGRCTSDAGRPPTSCAACPARRGRAPASSARFASARPHPLSARCHP
jgi:arginyl-tRNA synthetase